MRVIDKEALRKHVADFPDLTHKERAAHFKVSEFGIGYGLCKLVSREKRHSDISNAVMKNEQPIGKNSQ
ncbi:MAG: IS630 transposase-related protein [Candidatus Poribacteria bacterium]|nr:IS630 transposase-related protein [Candidatus Poribacteria bacterium]